MSLLNILILSNLATVILTILTIVHTARLSSMRSVRWLIALSVTFLIGSFCLLNVYVTPDIQDKVLFLHLRVWGMAFLTPCWLYFLNSVFDVWSWLNKKWVTWIMFAPSVFNLFLIANPSTRDLLFKNFAPISFMGVTSAKFDFGDWYQPFYLWAMVQMLASYVISVIAFLRHTGDKRKQVLILNIGLTISLLQSLVAHLLSSALEIEFIVTNTFPLLGTSIGILYAVVYHRLLSIVPLAMVRIFNQLPDPVFVLDDESRVMGANVKAIRFFELGDNYLGQTFEKVVPRVPISAGEIVLYSENAGQRFFNIALERIGNDGSTSHGTIIFLRDITAQKIVELNLMERVDFRTRLLALMAHDLSGFVSTQALIAQNLQKKINTEHTRYFDHLENLTIASQSLISNVMSWTQKESVNFEIVKSSFEWNTLINEVLEQVQGRLTLKEIEVIFDHPSQPLLGTGDSELIASVFRNILFNSIRASAQKKKIFVCLKSVDSVVSVEVRDEGEGIEASELQRILDVTERFALNGVSRAHGTGIGLMLARYFVSLHHGTFSMESELRTGTKVVFTIPL